MTLKSSIHLNLAHTPSSHHHPPGITPAESGQEGYHLYRLPQAHLVPENTAAALLMELPQPAHTHLLVPGGVCDVTGSAQMTSLGPTYYSSIIKLVKVCYLVLLVLH